MFDWLRELVDIKLEYRERKKVCESCNFLRTELARSNIDRNFLIQQLLSKKDESEAVNVNTNVEPILPKTIHWRIKQQELEANDRAEAAALEKQRKEAAAAKLNTAKLEESIGIGESNAS